MRTVEELRSVQVKDMSEEERELAFADVMGKLMRKMEERIRKTRQS